MRAKFILFISILSFGFVSNVSASNLGASGSAGRSVASLVIGPSTQKNAEEEFFETVEKAHVTAAPAPKRSMSSVEPESTEMPSQEPAPRPPVRASSDANDEICQGPVAQFKQCSFTCEGNPKGSGVCRTDLAEVHCVRRTCDASGNWSDVRQMPKSRTGACVPGRSVVADCGSDL